MKIDILGTEYEIITMSRDSDTRLKDVDGFCDGYSKQIVISDLKQYDTDPDETLIATRKQILRHEIVHAFLDESGLNYDASVWGNAWSKNEEMVDWIAWQFPKILLAFQKVGCLN